MMCAAIIGGTAYKTWGWPMGVSLADPNYGRWPSPLRSSSTVSWSAVLNLPPFIATLGTMMISMGVGSIVSNVRSATFPTRSESRRLVQGLFQIHHRGPFFHPHRELSVLFGVAFLSLHHYSDQDKNGPIHLRHRIQQRGGPSFRCECQEVGDDGLRGRRYNVPAWEVLPSPRSLHHRHARPGDRALSSTPSPVRLSAEPPSPEASVRFSAP